jgi:nucleotidyltransferase/DNA polymerase involved in DNA repair
MCGGKVGEALSSVGITTLGHVMNTDHSELMNHIGESSSIWLKELSEGYCYEEVKVKTNPTSSNAVKTFKSINTFKELEKMITLVMMDLV